jgi:hypothetical protein
MFLFGHLGIGMKLADPWARRLRTRYVLLGTILPDLIDKPLYYGLSWITHKRGAELGLISGTRTFGHTALSLILMTTVATVFRIRWLAAISIGVATHLLLDNLGDRFFVGHSFSLQALAWPFLGWHFPDFPFANAHEHLSLIRDPYFLICELIGILFLLWEYWKRTQVRQIKL